MSEEERDRLFKVLEKENSDLRHALLDNRLMQTERRLEGHERRLKPIEEAVTKFNFLLFLVAGGGLISIINLSALIYVIVERLQP